MFINTYLYVIYYVNIFKNLQHVLISITEQISYLRHSKIWAVILICEKKKIQISYIRIQTIIYDIVKIPYFIHMKICIQNLIYDMGKFHVICNTVLRFSYITQRKFHFSYFLNSVLQ